MALSAPWAAARIDFTAPSSAPQVHRATHAVPIATSGEAHCVLFWWDLHLTDHITLSTAPGWARTDDGWATSTAYRPAGYQGRWGHMRYEDADVRGQTLTRAG